MINFDNVPIDQVAYLVATYCKNSKRYGLGKPYKGCFKAGHHFFKVKSSTNPRFFYYLSSCKNKYCRGRYSSTSTTFTYNKCTQAIVRYYQTGKTFAYSSGEITFSKTVRDVANSLYVKDGARVARMWKKIPTSLGLARLASKAQKEKEEELHREIQCLDQDAICSSIALFLSQKIRKLLLDKNISHQIAGVVVGDDLERPAPGMIPEVWDIIDQALSKNKKRNQPLDKSSFFLVMQNMLNLVPEEILYVLTTSADPTARLAGIILGNSTQTLSGLLDENEIVRAAAKLSQQGKLHPTTNWIK